MKESNELDQKKTEVLDKVAEMIVKRDLEMMATIILESTRPIHYLGGQALIFFEPFLNILASQEKIQFFQRPRIAAWVMAIVR